MKKVIEQSRRKPRSEILAERKYVKRCVNCKCVFTYQEEDIAKYREITIVKCPECEYTNDIFFKRIYRK